MECGKGLDGLPNGHWLKLTGPIRTSPFAIARVGIALPTPKKLRIKEYLALDNRILGSVTPSGQFTLLVLTQGGQLDWTDHVGSRKFNMV